jgi:hypothetical protein
MSADDPASPRSLSYLHLNAIECLKRKSAMDGGPPYGSLALTYSLMGNGNLKVCSPVKRQP